MQVGYSICRRCFTCTQSKGLATAKQPRLSEAPFSGDSAAPEDVFDADSTEPDAVDVVFDDEDERGALIVLAKQWTLGIS